VSRGEGLTDKNLRNVIIEAVWKGGTLGGVGGGKGSVGMIRPERVTDRKKK